MKPHVLYVRVDADTMTALDALVERKREDDPDLSRSDVVRAWIRKMLKGAK